MRDDEFCSELERALGVPLSKVMSLAQRQSRVLEVVKRKIGKLKRCDICHRVVRPNELCRCNVAGGIRVLAVVEYDGEEIVYQQIGGVSIKRA